MAGLQELLDEYNQTLNPFGRLITRPQLESIIQRLEAIVGKNQAPQTVLQISRVISSHILVNAVAEYGNKTIEEVLLKNKEHNYLGLSINNACEKGCMNCASEAKKNGIQVEFSKLEELDKRYFQWYPEVSFGLEGEPFFYQDNGKNLGDVMALLLDKGARKFSILTGGFFANNPLYEKAVDKIDSLLSSIEKLGIEISYNHYTENLERNQESFIQTLKILGPLRIPLALRVVGDFQLKRSNLNETEKGLLRILEQMGFESCPEGYQGKIGGMWIKLQKPVKTTSIPMGRYQPEIRKLYLSEKSIEKNPEKPPICDHLSYQQVFVDYNGGLKFCPRIVAYDKPPITNLFEKNYSEVMEDLNRYHHHNYDWLKARIIEIIQGKVKSCLCTRVDLLT